MPTAIAPDDTITATFRALGDPSRVQILQHIKSGNTEQWQLVDATGMSQPTVSHHMRVLIGAGLVAREGAVADIEVPRCDDCDARELAAIRSGGVR